MHDNGKAHAHCHDVFCDSQRKSMTIQKHTRSARLFSLTAVREKCMIIEKAHAQCHDVFCDNQRKSMTIRKRTRSARLFSLTTPLIKNFNIPGMGTIGNSVFRIIALSHQGPTLQNRGQLSWPLVGGANEGNLFLSFPRGESKSSKMRQSSPSFIF